ncbi:MAG: D-alanyl-D-alanine carboxypeptidase [Oscillospiraceae bacterium]|nr:D-alanyl-D-alanine carboxypeptidase [Oscillospiraceae bacterium]
MEGKRRHLLAGGLAALMLWGLCPGVSASEGEELITVLTQPAAPEISAKSGILIEQTTGQILYEKNAHEKMHPASVTKIMTLLLVMEAIDSGKISLEDRVVTSDYASSMGGSEIWLAPGEEMSVHDLIKATAVSSANDAAVALGEHVAGSNDGFVAMMNRRAQELGMADTQFVNAHGLDAEGHMTSAHDIAVMSRELLSHSKILEYTTIWMDTLRDGATSLVNTNRLIRFYKGATGLKTGTTSLAGSCLSASASREGVSFIAVVMGCATSDERFASARALLDHGFANWETVTPELGEEFPATLPVVGGIADTLPLAYDPPAQVLIPKGRRGDISRVLTLPEALEAPVEEGQVLGKVEYFLDDEKLGESAVFAGEGVRKKSFWDALLQMLLSMLKM